MSETEFFGTQKSSEFQRSNCSTTLYFNGQKLKALLTKDKIVLSELCVPDFLVHGVAVVDVRVAAEAGFVQLLSHLLCVRVEGWTHGNDHRLTRAQPEWPFTLMNKQ